MDIDEVGDVLKERGGGMLKPGLFVEGFGPDKVTKGYRAQSSRGPHGRLPIVGSLGGNKFVFTALSGRGMVHHGIYGDAVARVILWVREEEFGEEWGLGWWRPKHAKAHS